MIQWLAKKGYDCTVITTYPYYPFWKVQQPYSKNRFWYKTENQHFATGNQITICRCPMYVPANPSGAKRMLLDFSFLLTAFIKTLHLFFSKKSFDFVITVAPSFHFGLLGILSKYIWKSKFVYHIQDMQIEAARNLQMIKSPGIINLLFKLERFILNNADFISTISEGMVERIKEKAGKEIVFFPNWTDNALFYPVANNDILKSKFGFQPSDKICLYSGAIGEKQGLEAIIDAAEYFKKQQDVKFLICGSGPYKESLQKLADSMQLTNIIFLPLQPPEEFNNFLNMADVHLVIQKENASDLVMPSKLNAILSVGGLALITANPGSGLHTLVSKHKVGLLVAAESQSGLNEGLVKALRGHDINIPRNARTYAEKYLAIDKIMESFEKSVLKPIIQ